MKTSAKNLTSFSKFPLVRSHDAKKGKVRVTVTILPQTKKWLARGGNVSERIDEVVRQLSLVSL
ncbi:hypothetical protein GTQ43_00170 [Nostoc sp. KVJ3]|uniref:hypothetical protein n=1 Tax=Nostoc sp. KVJ3 TaxID=457945 RepID=UPI0022388398|nr:hypothetical protein [Nostoc sp. KVJ3]MCW5312323.1 hypothetical protein [Nostoc sp. KVJ3]